MNIQIEKAAKLFIRKNKRLLIQTFANSIDFTPVKKPFTLFMAGSPGAGKTEFSKSFIHFLKEENTDIVRIDPDAIRDLIPQYSGGNAYQVQGAAALGVEKLIDYVQDKNLNAIVDGTFSDLNVDIKNIQRAVNKGRNVGIIYIFQDPIIAWDFTKKREVVEGRKVSKEFFIKSFLTAKINVEIIRKMFKDKISVDLVKKDYQNKTEEIFPDIEKIDNYLDFPYNEDELKNKLI